VPWHLDPSSVTPAAVQRFQAVRYRTRPWEAIDEILAGAQLEPDDRRAFLSYAHADTAMALDLMEELSEQRFQVFLDTHRIPPATLWEVVLKDAIVDAAMVVVLETANSLASIWVAHEVAFALARASGLVAIHPFPRDPVFRTIGEGLRARTADMAAAARFVTRQHRLQLAYRRESLVQAVERELRSRKLNPTRSGSRVETGNTSTTAHPRPVTVSQLRRLTDSAGNRSAFVLSPTPVLRSKQADRDWLRRAGAEIYPEGSLTALGAQIGALG
jgi:hypothetical protein